MEEGLERGKGEYFPEQCSFPGDYFGRRMDTLVLVGGDCVAKSPINRGGCASPSRFQVSQRWIHFTDLSCRAADVSALGEIGMCKGGRDGPGVLSRTVPGGNVAGRFAGG